MFVDLEAPVRGTARGVSMSAQERKSGAVVLRLSIPAELLEEFGQTGYAIRLGRGEDRGALMVVPAAGGAFKPTVLGRKRGGAETALFYLGAVAFAPDGKQRRTPCAWARVAEGLRIALPRWCAPDEEGDA